MLLSLSRTSGAHGALHSAAPLSVKDFRCSWLSLGNSAIGMRGELSFLVDGSLYELFLVPYSMACLTCLIYLHFQWYYIKEFFFSRKIV
jgi:hypothetical protein